MWDFFRDAFQKCRFDDVYIKGAAIAMVISESVSVVGGALAFVLAKETMGEGKSMALAYGIWGVGHVLSSIPAMFAVCRHRVLLAEDAMQEDADRLTQGGCPVPQV